MNNPNPIVRVRCHVCGKIARTDPALTIEELSNPQERDVCECDRYYNCHICGRLLAEGCGSHVCANGIFKLVPRGHREGADHFAA